MRKLLIPIFGHSPARAKTAVAEGVAIYQQEQVEIHLLSVQPGVSGHVAMFFKPSELHEFHHDAGEADLAPARALLDLAGIPCQTSMVVGRSAESIARRARELGCDRILMGPESSDGFSGRWLGGLAGQVRHIVGGAGDCQVLGS